MSYDNVRERNMNIEKLSKEIDQCEVNTLNVEETLIKFLKEELNNLKNSGSKQELREEYEQKIESLQELNT